MLFLQVFWSTALFLLTEASVTNQYTDTDFCPNLKLQTFVNIDQLMGMWYAVQIFYHKHEEGRDHSYIVVDNCPRLHLSKLSLSDLKLVWDERAGLVEYHFKLSDSRTPGLWISSGPQNGSIVLRRPYEQFTGTVHVMKAVSSHLVLTFCTRQPEKLFYSVLMSREKRLGRDQVNGVRSMLETRGLKSHGIREACRNSSYSTHTSLVSIFTAVLLSVVVACS